MVPLSSERSERVQGRRSPGGGQSYFYTLVGRWHTPEGTMPLWYYASCRAIRRQTQVQCACSWHCIKWGADSWYSSLEAVAMAALLAVVSTLRCWVSLSRICYRALCLLFSSSNGQRWDIQLANTFDVNSCVHDRMLLWFHWPLMHLATPLSLTGVYNYHTE